MVTGSRSGFYYGYVIVSASFLILLLTVGMYVTIGVFFKPMLHEFSWSRAVTSGPVAVSGLFNGLGAIVMGGLTDRLGPRRVVIACGLLSGIGYIMMSRITDIWQLYIFYSLLIGAGLSLMVPLMSNVVLWFKNRRSVMTGIILAGGGAGGLIVPLLANWLVIEHGWRQAYLILGLALLVIVPIAALLLKTSPSQSAAAIRTAEQPREQASAIPDGYTLSTSIRTLSFWLLLVSSFFFGFTVGTVQIHLIPYATDINITPTIAATVFSVMSGVVVIGCIVLGILGDRFGNKRLYVATFVGLAVAIFWLGYIRELWMLFIFAVIFGLSNGSGFAQGSPLAARIFGVRALGAILGMLTLGQAVGVAAGGFLAGYIYDIKSSYQMMFLICGTGACIAVLSTALLKPVKPAQQADNT